MAPNIRSIQSGDRGILPENLYTAMMFAASLIITLYLAIQVSTTPVVQTKQPIVSLPFTKRFNLTSGHRLVQHGQARAKAFMPSGTASSQAPRARDGINVPVENQEVVYVATVGIGSGGDTYQLIVDTGSSNTWVGANKPYVRTNTSMDTGDILFINYGEKALSGQEFIDRVVLGSGPSRPTLVIPRQSIGSSKLSIGGFDGLDGILGIGPTGLTRGTLTLSPDSVIPTVTDSLCPQLDFCEVGVSFEPTDTPRALNGELTWGGVDITRFIPPITWIPLTTTAPASRYWGIDGAMRYDTSTSIFANTAGIVDTGTTALGMSTEAFRRYQKATGAVYDIPTGLLLVNFAQLKSLFFIAGGSTFELTPNAQIWPRDLNTDIGGTASNVYLAVFDSDLGLNGGLDFILGQTFLERFYSVYDTGNRRVGLANTMFTTADTN